MREWAWIPGSIAALALLPAAAQAQGVSIAAGEEVTLTLRGGVPEGVRRAPATPTPFEAAVGRQFSGMTPPEAPVPEGTPLSDDGSRHAAPVPEPGTLRFRFLQVPGTTHSMLIVHNGYARALVYRARISARGKTEPTDVCLVPPGKIGVEHWPYAITAIEVSAFESVVWKPEDGLPCK